MSEVRDIPPPSADTVARPRWSAAFKVAVGMLVAMVGCVVAFPYLDGTNPIPFDPVRWHRHYGDESGRTPRLRMVGDLLEKHKLIGMTRGEIEALLGPIEFEGPHESPGWDLGHLPDWGITLPHGTTLRIQFGPDGRVSEVMWPH